MQQNYNKNNKSLAMLGQGRWKHAFKFTLLLIGMLALGVNNAWAQNPIPEAVKLDKQFIPDDPTGHSGKIILETYVTGKVTQVTASQPTDIVLVLDYSMSMNSSYPGASSRRAALEQSVQGFINAIQQDAETNGCEHRMAVVKFSSQSATSILSISGHPTWGNNNTPSFSQTQYQNALVVVNDNGSVNTSLTNTSLFDGVGVDNGTVMNAGLNIAYRILLARNQTTFVLPNTTTEMPRNMVVVFFTDGYPTASHGASESTMHNYWQNGWDMHTVANNSCQQAANIKGLAITSGGQTVKPTIFSIGIHADCDPTATYRTELRSNGRWYTGVQCLNGLMHFISSDYDETLTSWTDNTTTTDFRNDEHYLAPQDANDLIEAFGKITSASGSTPVNLGSNTVVQDIISPSFQLPEGTDVEDIIVYAPKVTQATGTEGNYVLTFADTTTVKIGNQVQFLTIENGVVQDNEAKENRIDPNDIIDEINGKTLTFTGFDFSAQFCGPKLEGDEIVGCEGRKLVIVFPIEIAEGVWGDGLNTNDELSFVTPDGTIQYQFPMPVADVAADVWTEVIVEEPSTFTYNSTKEAYELHNPEDLAWFVSWVNGRLKYETPYNTTQPHPSANAILMADIDMSAHNWVPIGEGTKGYTGTFDGNGHVITGLKNNASKYYKLEKIALVYPGMFSNVKGTVKNLFVLDADFHAKNHLLNPTDEFKTFIHFGIIADTLSTNGQIFNCEAAGTLMCNNDTETVHSNNETQLARDMQIIIGGLVGLNNGGAIHSSMAMAELTGYTMGGMIGINGGSFSNGFTNGVYNYLDNNATGKYVGGIAGTNTGTIDNCYVRFERTTNSNLNKLGTGFGMIYGSNAGNVTNCYIPQISTFTRPTTTSTTSETNTNPTIPNVPEHPSGYPANSNSYTLSVTPTFYNMFINDNMTGGTWGTWNGFNVYENGTPLLDKLIAGKGNGASWKRTTAGAYFAGSGDINDDYPVLAFDKFGEGDDAPKVTCLGSSDGIRIDYATSLNEMLHRHNNGNMNENTNISNEYTQSKPNYYKVTEHRAIYKGAINLYANDDVTLDQAQPSGKDGETVDDNSTAEGVVVYIDENISLLQDASSSIEAYTGQTLQAYDNTASDAGERWHNVSSSLSNSQFGWTYSNYAVHNFEANPCGWTLPNTNEDRAFFPVDIFSYHRAEFYCFFEPEYHWINFRRRGDSHWHMDNYEQPIAYYYNQPNADYTQFTKVEDNETQFIPGKGYLTCVDMSMWWEFELNETTYSKQAQFMQNRGTLNNGTIGIPVTYTTENEWTGLAGYNLLGNPYQSYLDFATFASVNSDLWDGDANAMTYAVYDPTLGIYAQATAAGQASQGAYAATGDINMHQGFFICAKKSGTATFNNTMRSNEPASGTHFRGERLNYPVINLIATDRQGNTDVAVLEVGRPENAGGQKLRVGSATGRISLRHDNTDFGILFRDMTEGNQPLYFNAEEDGTFTLNWNTANANFSSLTLVDNITGVRTDMLAHDSYAFEGRTSDYKSRFKILIGEFTDIEEQEETVTNNFAFFDGSEWVVNGQGQLTVTDVMGRTVYNGNLANEQNRVNLNNVAPGVYLMQVLNANGAMVQKIVVR